MAEQRNKKYSIEFKLYDGTTRSVSIEIPLGEDGGYYIPSIENKNGETLIYFTPSSPDMPAMEPIPVLNLNEVIDMALTQAKESGEFDGKNGEKGETGPAGPQGPEGPQGEKGEPGADGINGQDGQPGKDGSPGKDGADGKTPVKGEDYWTDADKQEFAADIMQAAAGMLLPNVTAADNGKILQVVNGAWAKVEVKDSYVATFVDDYISSALEGDY